MKYLSSILAIVGLILMSQLVYADSITDTFSTGDTLTVATMDNIKSAVNDNDSRISALESALATLQATVANQASTIGVLQSDLTAVNTNIGNMNSSLSTVLNSDIMDLDAYLTVTTVGGSKATLSGINLQIVNGLGSTDTINGLGNLIIGYDEVQSSFYLQRCSYGTYSDPTSCVNAGHTWSLSHKSGSHYLVLGSENNYLQYGGLVAGFQNFVTNRYSSVTGGNGNTANGSESSVSGGRQNTASAYGSTVLGWTGVGAITVDSLHPYPIGGYLK